MWHASMHIFGHQSQSWTGSVPKYWHSSSTEWWEHNQIKPLPSDSPLQWLGTKNGRLIQSLMCTTRQDRSADKPVLGVLGLTSHFLRQEQHIFSRWWEKLLHYGHSTYEKREIAWEHKGHAFRSGYELKSELKNEISWQHPCKFLSSFLWPREITRM